MAITKKLQRKNILIIIASKDFRDEEYFIPFEILQREGAKITTASSKMGEIIGINGGEARATLTLKEVDIKNYDAVIFAGGSGAKEYFDNNDAHRIAHEALSKNKILGAICIAPVILAKSGVLRGKEATVWSSALDKKGVEELKNAGCLVSDKKIVIDGIIVTADGPAMSKDFAKAIIDSISKAEKN